MRWSFPFVIPSAIMATMLPAAARECWFVEKLNGYSAISSENYEFVENGISQPVTVCFTDEGGIVTGLDVPLVKFGNSTLAGYGGNELGNEMFVVYQIDRVHGKLLFMQTRVGTGTIVPALPDILHAFVGNAVRLSE